MSHPVIQYDDLDTRREAYRLLARLPPSARVAFVQSCCDTVTIRGTASRPFVAARTRALARRARWDDSADRRLSLELWFDLWQMASHFGLDLGTAFIRLESGASRG